jgi:hypothetical protein
MIGRILPLLREDREENPHKIVIVVFIKYNKYKQKKG